jgi:hypothetical protein
MSWISRLFGKDSDQNKKPVYGKANIDFARLNYPPKIMLAWSKALEGHTDLGKFLLDNGYEELFHTTQAILLKQEARDWLMKNGYPHLMAMVNASEGNESALHWLDVHGFEILYHVANAVEGEMTSFEWLRNTGDEMVFLVARTIKKVKDNIEFNHNDMYSFGKDA